MINDVPRAPALHNTMTCSRKCATIYLIFGRVAAPRLSGISRRAGTHRTDGFRDYPALRELGSEETRLRRQRAHDVASVLGSLHVDGLDVDPQEAFAIAQRLRRRRDID
jgi:hypothetical protein